MHGVRQYVPLDGLAASIARGTRSARGAAFSAQGVSRRSLQMLNASTPKRAAESATVVVEVVLPNDANPMGFMLGGNVMRLIDLAGAIAAIRHARSPMVTAAVDGLQFLNPIKEGGEFLFCFDAAAPQPPSS